MINNFPRFHTVVSRKWGQKSNQTFDENIFWPIVRHKTI